MKIKKFLLGGLLTLAGLATWYAIIQPNINGLTATTSITPSSAYIMTQDGTTQRRISAQNFANSISGSFVTTETDPVWNSESGDYLLIANSGDYFNTYSGDYYTTNPLGYITGGSLSGITLQNVFDNENGEITASYSGYLEINGTNSAYFNLEVPWFIALNGYDWDSSIRLLGAEMLVVDNTNNQGLVYDADYSGNYTARSLVDKAYVDWQWYITGYTETDPVRLANSWDYLLIANSWDYYTTNPLSYISWWEVSWFETDPVFISASGDFVHLTWDEAIYWEKTFENDTVFNGNTFFNGTATYINSTNLDVEDKNIYLWMTTGATDITANNGGWLLSWDERHWFLFDNANDSLDSQTDSINIPTGQQYRIDDNNVFASFVWDSTTLGASQSAISGFVNNLFSGYFGTLTTNYIPFRSWDKLYDSPFLFSTGVWGIDSVFNARQGLYSTFANLSNTAYATGFDSSSATLRATKYNSGWAMVAEAYDYSRGIANLRGTNVPTNYSAFVIGDKWTGEYSIDTVSGAKFRIDYAGNTYTDGKVWIGDDSPFYTGASLSVSGTSVFHNSTYSQQGGFLLDVLWYRVGLYGAVTGISTGASVYWQTDIGIGGLFQATNTGTALKAEAQNISGTAIETKWAIVLTGGSIPRRFILSGNNLSIQAYTGGAWTEISYFTP